jgi:hypothetical protein
MALLKMTKDGRMILNTSDIVLPELEEPICCTNRFSVKGAEKKPTEYWQNRQDIADLVGPTTLD